MNLAIIEHFTAIETELNVTMKGSGTTLGGKERPA
jgi:hypothetical protein